jgi:integrase
MSTRTQVNKAVPDANRNPKSGQKKTNQDSKTARLLHGKKYPKSDKRHWLERVKKEDSADYGVQIYFRGERHRIPLKTPNKEVAAERAVSAYLRLRHEKKWDGVLAEYRLGATAPIRGTTVGDLVEVVSRLVEVRPRTLAGNVATFRRIVAEVESIQAPLSRFAANGAGRNAWLIAVDAVPLASITPQRIQAWKLAFVKSRSNTETQARASRNTVNSMLRAAKSLFAKKLIDFLAKELALPPSLPFDGVTFFPRQSMRYDRNMKLEEVVRDAVTTLKPADTEAFKAFVLCLYGGLRRNECDKLRWSSIDFEKGHIRVEVQVDFAPKAETSLRHVPIEPEVVGIFQKLRDLSPKAEYVLDGNAVPMNAKSAVYRAEDTFKRLCTWLRLNGVNTLKPIHTLRKEAGSLVYERENNVLAASRFLGHADIQVTSQHYTTQKSQPHVGIGNLLRQSVP